MRNAVGSLTGLMLAGCVSSGGPLVHTTSLSATRAPSRAKNRRIEILILAQ